MLNWAMMHDMLVVGAGPERPPKGLGGYLGAMAVQMHPWPEDSLEGIRDDEIGLYATNCVGWRVAEMAKVLKLGFDSVESDELKWPRSALAPVSR
jgi:hypothetical protein